MIDGVKQQKWWGWGEEGKAYRYEDKPKFAPFVMKMVGVDITAPVEPIPPFSSLDVPASRLSDTLRRRARRDHRRGLRADRRRDPRRPRLRQGRPRPPARPPRRCWAACPDVGALPRNAGARSERSSTRLSRPTPCSSRSAAAPTSSPPSRRSPARPGRCSSVNLGRMSRVLEIDEVSGLAHIEAGVFGPDMEDQLKARGWTMGHHPDSFVWSTLGGWIATRSSGMQSDKYGDIADICRGLTMVMPGQVLDAPAAAVVVVGPERPGDGARLRGPPRHHHVGVGERAPHPGGAGAPGLLLRHLRGRPAGLPGDRRVRRLGDDGARLRRRRDAVHHGQRQEVQPARLAEQQGHPEDHAPARAGTWSRSP